MAAGGAPSIEPKFPWPSTRGERRGEAWGQGAGGAVGGGAAGGGGRARVCCFFSSLSMGPPSRARPRAGSSDVEVQGLQGVRFDELLALVDLVAHEDGKNPVGLGGVDDGDLEEDPPLRVHRRLPELGRGHLAQALVALDVDALLPLLEEGVEEL